MGETGRSLEQTRRTFIKGTGMMVIGAAAAGFTGSIAYAKENDLASSIDDIKWDEEYDAVVVGAGAAGCAAAVTLATEGNGLKTLLIEKCGGPNGNSTYALGNSIWTNDVDGFYTYFKALAGDYTSVPDDVMKAYAEGVGENLDWVKGLGVDEDNMTLTQPGEETDGHAGGEYPELEDSGQYGYFGVGLKDDTKQAPHICLFLLGLIQDKYSDTVTYRPNTALIALIQDPSTKAVIGAVCGDGRYIKADKGVIMTCGGFENNPVMMENYLEAGGAKPAAGVGNTGDGHAICHKLGADFWHMSNVAGFWMSGRDLENRAFTNSQLANKPSPKQFGITVAVNGRRFYMDWDGFMTTEVYDYLSDLSGHVGSRHGHMQFGGSWPHLPMPSKAWFVFDQAGLEAGAIPATTSTDPVADGLAYTADTVEELADQMGVPSDELSKTIDTWNGYCDTGEDLAFFRPADTMTPISTPPYYAQLCAPAFLNTDGGPIRSANGEILDPDGEPIPGLYSAGEFGSVWGYRYQGAGNIAECLIFGRISARSIIGGKTEENIASAQSSYSDAMAAATGEHDIQEAEASSASMGSVASADDVTHSCIGCHTQPEIDKWTAEETPQMVVKSMDTGLSDDEAAAISSYIANR